MGSMYTNSLLNVRGLTDLIDECSYSNGGQIIVIIKSTHIII